MTEGRRAQREMRGRREGEVGGEGDGREKVMGERGRGKVMGDGRGRT